MASANRMTGPNSAAYSLKVSRMADAPLGIALKKAAKVRSCVTWMATVTIRKRGKDHFVKKKG